MNREAYGKLIFELSRPGRTPYRLPSTGVPEAAKLRSTSPKSTSPLW